MSVDPKVIRGVIGKSKLILTDKQFQVFRLFYEYNLTSKEIAEELKIPLSTAYRVLSSARRKMRNEWR